MSDAESLFWLDKWATETVRNLTLALQVLYNKREFAAILRAPRLAPGRGTNGSTYLSFLTIMHLSVEQWWVSICLLIDAEITERGNIHVFDPCPDR